MHHKLDIPINLIPENVDMTNPNYLPLGLERLIAYVRSTLPEAEKNNPILLYATVLLNFHGKYCLDEIGDGGFSKIDETTVKSAIQALFQNPALSLPSLQSLLQAKTKKPQEKTESTGTKQDLSVLRFEEYTSAASFWEKVGFFLALITVIPLLGIGLKSMIEETLFLPTTTRGAKILKGVGIFCATITILPLLFYGAYRSLKAIFAKNYYFSLEPAKAKNDELLYAVVTHKKSKKRPKNDSLLSIQPSPSNQSVQAAMVSPSAIQLPPSLPSFEGRLLKSTIGYTVFAGTQKSVTSIVLRVKGSITHAGQQALNYCFEHFLSQPYTDDEGTYFPALYRNKQGLLAYYPEDEKKAQTSFKTVKKVITPLMHETDKRAVYRSNHGLTHTVSTLWSIDDVVDFNLAYAAPAIQNFIQNNTATPEARERFIIKLQVAMVFYISGRGGEAGFREKQVYERYRRASKEHFLQYVKAFTLVPSIFDSEEEVVEYGKALEHAWISEEEIAGRGEAAAPLKALLFTAHTTDLHRCKTAKDMDEVVAKREILRFVPKEKQAEARTVLLDIYARSSALAKEMCRSANNMMPLWCQYEHNALEAEKFFEYETSVEKCVTHINDFALREHSVQKNQAAPSFSF